MSKPQEDSRHGPQGPRPRRILRITYIKQQTTIEVAQFTPQPPPKPPKAPKASKAPKAPKASNRVLNRPDMRSGLTPVRSTKDGTKKSLPAINETAKDACQLPNIHGAKGKGAKTPEQAKEAEKNNGSCYEDFLQDHVITARREGLINRYLNNYSSLSSRGMTAANIATLDAMDAKQKSLRPIVHQRTNNALWSAPMSEYGDTFGYLQRRYPPRTPHPPPRPVSHYPSAPFTLQRKGPFGHGPWSEYQANYHTKV